MLIFAARFWKVFNYFKIQKQQTKSSKNIFKKKLDNKIKTLTFASPFRK